MEMDGLTFWNIIVTLVIDRVIDRLDRLDEKIDKLVTG